MKICLIGDDLALREDRGNTSASRVIAIASAPISVMSALISAKAFTDLIRVDPSLPLRVSHMDIFFGIGGAVGAYMCTFACYVAIKDLRKIKRD